MKKIIVNLLVCLSNVILYFLLQIISSFVIFDLLGSGDYAARNSYWVDLPIFQSN